MSRAIDFTRPGHRQPPHPAGRQHRAAGSGHQQTHRQGGAEITDYACELVLKTLDALSTEQKADYVLVKEKVRAELKRLIQKTTGRRPMIMPLILEI